MTDHVTGDQTKRVTVEEARVDIQYALAVGGLILPRHVELTDAFEAAVREDERERIAQGLLSARTGYDGEEERTVTPEEFERIRKELQP